MLNTDALEKYLFGVFKVRTCLILVILEKKKMYKTTLFIVVKKTVQTLKNNTFRLRRVIASAWLVPIPYYNVISFKNVTEPYRPRRNETYRLSPEASVR